MLNCVCYTFGEGGFRVEDKKSVTLKESMSLCFSASTHAVGIFTQSKTEAIVKEVLSI